MTLKELGSCNHVRRGDRIVEFELKAHPPLEDKKNGQIHHASPSRPVGIWRAICPKCSSYMRWDNWTHLSEPLRAKCIGCGLYLPSTELNLLPAESTQAGEPETEKEVYHETERSHSPNPV